MGRHSRKRRGGDAGNPDAPEGAAAEVPRQPPPSARPPGGRGAPGADATGTPAHGTSLFGGPAAGPGPGTPPRGVPGVGPATRGGHPQHREPGGGWGASGAGQGPPTGGVPRVSPLPGRGTPNRPSGPRQEYLDAFDALDDTGENVFAAGAPQRKPQPRRPSQPQKQSQQQPPARAGREEPDPGPPEFEPPEPGHPLDDFPVKPLAVRERRAPDGDRDDEDRGPEPGPGRRPPDADEPYAPLAAVDTGGGKPARKRTFAGVGAAAVATVLAVVVGGQIVSGSHDRDTRAASRDVDRGRGDDASRSDARPGPAQGPAKPEAPLTYDDKLAAVLPLDGKLKGPGDFTAVPGRQTGAEGGPVMRYRVDVEKELPLDGELFAQAVHTTLNDERSWAHDDARSFERVSSGRADFVITLASPGTTAEWCAKSGLDTREQNVSCDSAATNRVMINAYRWAQGAKTFGDKLMGEYRQMLINHEVGHRLGHDHVGCEKRGEAAPVMMQQTKTLTTDGRTCRPNAWPFPHA
ncbi:DUF3152 domain-containing protein [Streptomyces phytohabitans]|uniref:DUF3152 domain-containing protein n=1 Tax=Streptomyces phytohabitans TaxID=1150371 RepID=UPI00345BCBD7